MNETSKTKKTISKDEIQALPRTLFDGRIIVISNERDAAKAVRYLLSQPLIGFDTETRPSFRKGEPHQVALLQLSTRSECFLFRLNRTGITDPIAQLLESDEVMKVGLSIQDDMRALGKRREIHPANFVELQREVKPFGIEEMSLQRIYAILFGERISKNQQLSNWEADILTEAQQRYAATDAWACIMILDKLQSLANHDTTITVRQ